MSATHERHLQLLAQLVADPSISAGALAAAFASIAREGAAALAVDRLNIWLFDVDQSQLLCHHHVDRSDASAPLPSPLESASHPRYLQSLNEARTLVAEDALRDPRLIELRDEYLLPHGVAARLDAPIRQRGLVVGAICAEHRTPRDWQASEMAVLASLADFASLALATASNVATEARLREQQAGLELILGHAEVVIFTIDSSGHFEYISPSVRHYAAMTPAELVGNDWQALVHADDRALIVLEVARLFTEGTPRVLLDYRVPDSVGEGRWRTLSAAVTLMRGSDGHRRVLGSAIDVTEQRAAAATRAALAEQLEQSRRHQALGRLAGGIAHEFNNLLTVILGGADLLRMHGEHSPNDIQVIDSIRAATLRASRFTRQLLAFSGRQLLDLQRLDVAGIVEDLLPLLRGSIPTTVRLSVQRVGLLPAVLADRAALEQVLLELVLRAVNDLLGGGEVVLQLSTIANSAPRTLRGGELQPGDYVCVRISDTAPPLGEDELRLKFEPFSELLARDEPLGLEQRLRLAAAFGSVQQHHGVVDARVDEPLTANGAPRGNSFLIYLPVHAQLGTRESTDATVREPAAHAYRTHLGSRTETQRAARVLVVEDEPEVLNLATLILQAAGYDTEGVQAVESALRRIEDDGAHFDLLITDVVMPGLDGVRLYQRLQRTSPTLRVIYMSGYAPDDLPATVTQESITSYLQKPFTLARLREKVHEVLNG